MDPFMALELQLAFSFFFFYMLRWKVFDDRRLSQSPFHDLTIQS